MDWIDQKGVKREKKKNQRKDCSSEAVEIGRTQVDSVNKSGGT